MCRKYPYLSLICPKLLNGAGRPRPCEAHGGQVVDEGLGIAGKAVVGVDLSLRGRGGSGGGGGGGGEGAGGGALMVVGG